MNWKWKAGWAVLGAACGLMLICMLSILTQAATLSISGSATGNGSQILQVAGDNLTAWWNGTAWHIEGAM